MPDGTFNTNVHFEEGGNTLTVASGGNINIKTGGQITVNGLQAALGALIPTGGTTVDTQARAAIDAIITLLQALGAST
jgi:hypothetical protein